MLQSVPSATNLQVFHVTPGWVPWWRHIVRPTGNEWEALHALRFGQRHHSAARLVAESRGGLWNFGISLQVKTQASDSHQPRGNAASSCFFPLSPWSHFSRNNNCVSLEKQTRHHWRTVNCMHSRHQSPF